MNCKRKNRKYDCRQHHTDLYTLDQHTSLEHVKASHKLSYSDTWYPRPECSLDLSQLCWEEIKYNSTNIIVNMSQFLCNRQHFQDATFHHSSSCKCGSYLMLMCTEEEYQSEQKLNIKVNVHIHVFSNTHNNYPHISWLQLKDKASINNLISSIQ
jgi:hypothetical protein